jgi:hypothetical protein
MLTDHQLLQALAKFAAASTVEQHGPACMLKMAPTVCFYTPEGRYGCYSAALERFHYCT